jgi:hypothetical protein
VVNLAIGQKMIKFDVYSDIAELLYVLPSIDHKRLAPISNKGVWAFRAQRIAETFRTR